jgi:TonB family protein
MRKTALLMAGLLAAALPARALHAQPQAQAMRTERCSVIGENSAMSGPTDGQVRERTELRDRIQEVLRAHGQPVGGLLLVDVDGARQGKVMFIDAPLADSTRRAATALVAAHLETLPAGRPYQALVRIDADYPAMTPGRVHCRPELANADSLSAMIQAVLARHPEAGTHAQLVQKRAAVRMVVTREGRVAYVEVDQPTGDAFIDQNVEAIAMRLRFNPATLDGDPFDVRFRFTLTFNVR